MSGNAGSGEFSGNRQVTRTEQNDRSNSNSSPPSEKNEIPPKWFYICYNTRPTDRPLAFEACDLRSLDSWTDLYLQWSVLERSDLRNLKLTRCDLEGANLCNVDLRGANLRNVNLKNAILDGANISHAQLTGVSLQNASMKNLEGEDCHLLNVDLRGANISSSSFNQSKLEEVTMTEVSCDNASFRFSKLLWVTYSETCFLKADMRGAEIRRKLEEPEDPRIKSESESKEPAPAGPASSSTGNTVLSAPLALEQGPGTTMQGSAGVELSRALQALPHTAAGSMLPAGGNPGSGPVPSATSVPAYDTRAPSLSALPGNALHQGGNVMPAPTQQQHQQQQQQQQLQSQGPVQGQVVVPGGVLLPPNGPPLNMVHPLPPQALLPGGGPREQPASFVDNRSMEFAPDGKQQQQQQQQQQVPAQMQMPGPGMQPQLSHIPQLQMHNMPQGAVPLQPPQLIPAPEMMLDERRFHDEQERDRQAHEEQERRRQDEQGRLHREEMEQRHRHDRHGDRPDRPDRRRSEDDRRAHRGDHGRRRGGDDRHRERDDRHHRDFSPSRKRSYDDSWLGGGPPGPGGKVPHPDGPRFDGGRPALLGDFPRAPGPRMSGPNGMQSGPGMHGPPMMAMDIRGPMVRGNRPPLFGPRGGIP